jgi:hypothetical protein
VDRAGCGELEDDGRDVMRGPRAELRQLRIGAENFLPFETAVFLDGEEAAVPRVVGKEQAAHADVRG